MTQAQQILISPDNSALIPAAAAPAPQFMRAADLSTPRAASAASDFPVAHAPCEIGELSAPSSEEFLHNFPQVINGLILYPIFLKLVSIEKSKHSDREVSDSKDFSEGVAAYFTWLIGNKTEAEFAAEEKENSDKYSPSYAKIDDYQATVGYYRRSPNPLKKLIAQPGVHIDAQAVHQEILAAFPKTPENLQSRRASYALVSNYII